MSYELVVVAHPDDECLFFGGLIHSKLQNPKVICVTDGNADGRGEERHDELKKSLELLGVHELEHWSLPDLYEKRLDISEIQSRLEQLDTPQEVYTHGPLGEYGHPHHQDVCFAVHRAFDSKCPVFGVAHNADGELRIELKAELFKLKAKILSEVYFKETERFINLVPLTHTEAFCQYSLDEVSTLYAYFKDKQTVDESKLEKLKWLMPYFRSGKLLRDDRLF